VPSSPRPADPVKPGRDATIPAMSRNDRFEELAATVGGFYRSWVIYLGLDLGLFRAIGDAGAQGLPEGELASVAGCQPGPISAWLRAAHAGDLVELEGGRVRLAPAVATVLLDDTHPEYLGGQFVVAVVSSLDYAGIVDFFRTGRTLDERPVRFHRAIEAVTVQDIAVFFQEGLAAIPDLAADLTRGGRIVDVACGGGRWLIAVARRFPATELVGVEFEPDSVARAKRHVAEAGLAERIRVDARTIPEMAYAAEFDLVYLQDALHELPDPTASLAASWAAVAPGGRLVVLDWCLPDDLEGERPTDPPLQEELLWGIQLDELYQGTSMYTGAGFARLFAAAGLPEPTRIDLPSGATLFVVQRPS
jgi:SAM-dependent methyltransferase